MENSFKLLDQTIKFTLSSSVKNKIQQTRSFLEEEIDKRIIYGVNTGFGHLANKRIPLDQLAQLQLNLIRSHAAGYGDENPQNITRLAMILLANSLAKGYSGIRLSTLETLLFFINHNITPVTYKIGSLGASGDLAPLAHIALSLVGEGEVYYNGAKMETHQLVLQKIFSPVQLAAKEGLALINGTHFITAYSLYTIYYFRQILSYNQIGVALSVEALRGSIKPFHPLISKIRNNPGQQVIAQNIYFLLNNSEIISSHEQVAIDHKVQDPYSLRCVPQVLGGVYQTLKYLQENVVYELNAVTDNPLIFPEDSLILSGGNFHAEPLAIPLESSGLAIVEMCSISERRIDRLLHPSTAELPSFLAKNPGVESGYMIPHYTVAGLLNSMKVLASPAVTDNTPVSGSQEDHVSMGMTSAVKTYQIVLDAAQIIGLEIFLAIRGLNMQSRPSTSDILEKIISAVNEHIPHVPHDQYVKPIMDAACQLVLENKLNQFLEVISV